MASPERKMERLQSVFFTTVIKHTQLTFKIDYTVQLPNLDCWPKYKCVYGVREREREKERERERESQREKQRQRDRLVHDQRFLSIYDIKQVEDSNSQES